MKLIEIRSLLDKAKARHNELVVKESLTEEERSELESKTAEVRDLQVKEVALAALEAPEPVHDTPEKREIKELISKANTGNYFKNVVGTGNLDSVEKELNSAYGLSDSFIPFELIEARTANFTQSAAADGPTSQQPVRPRFFATPVMNALGIRRVQVGVGEVDFPVLNTGAAPAAREEGAAANMVAADYNVSSFSPLSISAQIGWTQELELKIGAQRVQNSLTSDLRSSMESAMENMVINGNGSAPNASGYLDVITAPSNPTAVFTYANTKGLGASYVDGEWYGGMSNVNLVVRPEFVQVGEGLFSTSDDGTSLIDVLGRRVGSITSSKHMPLASNIAQGLAYGDSRGPAAVLPVWQGIRLSAVDVISNAGTAEKKVVAHVFYNFGMLYQRHTIGSPIK